MLGNIHICWMQYVGSHICWVTIYVGYRYPTYIPNIYMKNIYVGYICWVTWGFVDAEGNMLPSPKTFDA